MTQWKQHFVMCVSYVNERKRLLAAYHEGLGESEVGKALSAYRGRDRLDEILRERYFWYDMRSELTTTSSGATTRVNVSIPKCRRKSQHCTV